MGDRDGGEGESKCSGGAVLNVCWGDECSVDIIAHITVMVHTLH